MFGKNRREFSLLKQPKCKSEQMLLSLLKKMGLSLLQFSPPSPLIVASFWGCVAYQFYPLEGLNDAWC